jgi:methylmalonyl-CoA mutase N-terminal domain/subunit
VANTVDPFGGSFYVEALTDRIEKEASAYIEKIDALGGAVKAIEKGFVQREIQEASYQYQLAVENKDRIVVGLNEFTTGEAARPQLLKVDEAVERKQKEKLRALKAERNAENVGKCLQELARAARSEENLMPVILEAVRSYCTIGEIAGVLRDVFGEHREKAYI